MKCSGLIALGVSCLVLLAGDADRSTRDIVSCAPHEIRWTQEAPGVRAGVAIPFSVQQEIVRSLERGLVASASTAEVRTRLADRLDDALRKRDRAEAVLLARSILQEPGMGPIQWDAFHVLVTQRDGAAALDVVARVMGGHLDGRFLPAVPYVLAALGGEDVEAWRGRWRVIATLPPDSRVLHDEHDVEVARLFAMRPDDLQERLVALWRGEVAWKAMVAGGRGALRLARELLAAGEGEKAAELARHPFSSGIPHLSRYEALRIMSEGSETVSARALKLIDEGRQDPWFRPPVTGDPAEAPLPKVALDAITNDAYR